MSLHHGYVPDAWKIAHLLPILKKHGLEALFEIIKVQNDYLMSMDQREVTLLVLLDLSAIFGTDSVSVKIV